MARRHWGLKVVEARLSKAEVERRRRRLAGRRYVGRPWRKRDYEAVNAVRLAAGEMVRVSVGLAKAVAQASARGIDEDDVFAAVGRAVLSSLEGRAAAKVLSARHNVELARRLAAAGKKGVPRPVRAGCLGRSRRSCPKCGMRGLNRWRGPEKGAHLLCPRCGWTNLPRPGVRETVLPGERVRTKAEVPGRRSSRKK